MPAIASEIRIKARERLGRLAEHADGGNEPDRASWLDWLLREALGWRTHYHMGAEAAAIVREVPEYRTTLSADGILRDPDDALRAIVINVPYGTPFDARPVGSEWSATPIDRATELARANAVPIALLTDGDRVALVNVPLSTRDDPGETLGGYAVWHTALFAEGAEREYFAAFVALLHAQRFFNAAESETLEALFKKSAFTQADLTKTLGLQVRKAVELLVSAFSRANRERGGTLLDALPPHDVYEAAATVMMRLVFLLYAEERDLLPISDATYAQYYAVSTLRDQLDADVVRLGDEPLERRATGWRRLLATFEAIYDGIDHDKLRLPAYGGRLFNPQRFAFVSAARVDDLTTLAILTSLQTVTLGGESRRLSFLALDVEQIGHVYEGLLDHDAIRVDEVFLGFDGKSGAKAELALSVVEAAAETGRDSLVSMLVERLDRSAKAIEKGLALGAKMLAGEEPEKRRLVMTACESDEPLVRRILPYAPLLRTDLQDLPTIYAAGGIIVTKTRARRDSGTEYTPRVLAEEIVRYALEPLVYSPGPVDGADRAMWQVKASLELLDLKICDPACGSGAFLVAACRYLAERVAEAWQREGRIFDDDPVREAQCLISERCLYGVDRDAMAVEMAKLSLWLLTFSRERPFGFLDHAIRVGDSLLGITSLDQLRALHFDPERGRALHGGSLFEVIRPIEELIKDAVHLRQQVEANSTIDIADARRKARLNGAARKSIESAVLIADAMSAVALFTSEQPAGRIDASFAALANAIYPVINGGPQGVDDLATALADATRSIRLRIDSDNPSFAPARRPLQWPLEFPEVFLNREGFDVVVGNPPFLGGLFISARFGNLYRSFLVRWLAGNRRGSADLVAYFLLRSAAVAERFGLITTNTIAQGDTREVGLDSLAGMDWEISRAEKSRSWPGSASLQIAELWCRKSVVGETCVLGGTRVQGISPLLLPQTRIHGNPHRLLANAKIAFQGTIVLGVGFMLSADLAQQSIDIDARSAEILSQYITAEDVCDQPRLLPTRWVIDFASRSIDEAATYPHLFKRVEDTVKPFRSTNKNKYRRERWWQFAGPCVSLYKAIQGFTHIFVVPIVSKYSVPMLLPTNYTYANSLAVFASSSYELYGIVSSIVHQSWARLRGSTLETRPRYAATDCFETLPLPRDSNSKVSLIMERLHRHRELLMQASNQGITATYNLFHEPSVAHSAIGALREMHVDLDNAVMEAYGWGDLSLDFDFRATDDGLRFSISDSVRGEILDRLLELNHARHAEEAHLNGAAGGGTSKIRRPWKPTEDAQPLLLEHL